MLRIRGKNALKLKKLRCKRKYSKKILRHGRITGRRELSHGGNLVIRSLG